MCTVSYVSQKEGFVFTSNRDEAPKRNASELIQKVIGGKNILFPKDTGASGTWIAISDSNQLVCILNGAFVKHSRKLPYRLSRGIMALEFFEYDHAQSFFDEYDFQNIENFTMIIYDCGTLFEFRWDGEHQHIKQLNTKEHHIWSSCTLYPDEWVEKRQKWFAEWQMGKSEIIQDQVVDFHKTAGEGNGEYDVVMNRSNIVRTISVTSIQKTNETMKMRYEDLLESQLQYGEVMLSQSEVVD